MSDLSRTRSPRRSPGRAQESGGSSLITTAIRPEGAATDQPGATPREPIADPDPRPVRAKPAHPHPSQELVVLCRPYRAWAGNSSWSQGVALG